jgi:hypothetical protein
MSEAEFLKITAFAFELSVVVVCHVFLSTRDRVTGTPWIGGGKAYAGRRVVLDQANPARPPSPIGPRDRIMSHLS